MQHPVLAVFSLFLVVVGLGLGIREIRNPIRLTGAVVRGRRRLFGATLLCVLGGMIGNGPLPQGPVPKEVLMQSAGYWVGVGFLTLVLVGLAIWDTLDGVQALNRHLDLSEAREKERWAHLLEKNSD